MKLLGDPERLASVQFEHALAQCGECRDYHAVWIYRRLSRTLSGIESTAHIVGRLLRRAVPAGGRVLIAGAADAGLLDLVAGATHALAPLIDVADRCPTPLAVCRRYAESHGLSIATHQVDFGVQMPPGHYDAVLGDCVLQFVPHELHVDVLSRLRGVMNPNGALVLVERIRTKGYAGSTLIDRAAEAVNALAAEGVELPEDRASFQLRLNSMLAAQRERLARCRVADNLGGHVERAGFRIWDLPQEAREHVTVVPGGDSVSMNIIAASPL
jgi:hypothetical protein